MEVNFPKIGINILNVVGTNLAHYEIIIKAQKRGYERILILEDDCFIKKNILASFPKRHQSD